MNASTTLPVAVVGAGPVGLTAAAHLVARGIPFVVIEAGAEVGAAVRQWGHVAMFSPWRYTADKVARQLLETTGWQAPPQDVLPTGNDLVDRYVAPLGHHPAIAPHVRLNARVVAIGRKDFDKVRTRGRDEQPFEVHLASGEVIEARAVIDASGTWSRPNPAGSSGLEVPGERENADRIAYGIPDVTGTARGRYAGKRVAVVGSGHSAFNVVLDLLKLAEQAPGTEVVWVMRRDNLDTVWGGGSADALEARGQLGARAKQAVDAGRLAVMSPYRIRSIARAGDGMVITGALRGVESAVGVHELIVCTGFRPDLAMLNEIRLSVDPWLECAAEIGPLIDPNEHSCGTVRPHGAIELAHPEKDFFVIGMKSYGRAPTFLLATGFEQARSVVAFLDGDLAAATRVELELPETGVCSTDATAGGGSCCGTAPAKGVAAQPVALAVSPGVEAGCCGGPAPVEVDACCVKDADAKAAGEGGCGCGTPAPEPLLQITSRR
ncbi:MAG: FAD-dependent oxidoreductase [Vicinamibacterales bacterium]